MYSVDIILNTSEVNTMVRSIIGNIINFTQEQGRMPGQGFKGWKNELAKQSVLSCGQRQMPGPALQELTIPYKRIASPQPLPSPSPLDAQKRCLIQKPVQRRLLEGDPQQSCADREGLSSLETRRKFHSANQQETVNAGEEQRIQALALWAQLERESQEAGNEEPGNKTMLRRCWT